MTTEDPSGGLFKTIIEAGKDNIDFLAFALIAALVVFSMLWGLDFLSGAGIAVVLSSLWVAMRYALVRLQSHERLRSIRDHATMQAQKKLAEHATEDEIEDLFKSHKHEGGDDER